MTFPTFGTTTLAAFAAASVVLSVTPGPGVLYVVTRTLAQGRRAGLASVAGVALGNFGNAVGASIGLAALFAVSALAFTIVKWAGAAYLLWLGVQALRSPRATTDAPRLDAPRLGAIFRDGFLVALLNPKTALFFAAFLPVHRPRRLGHRPERRARRPFRRDRREHRCRLRDRRPCRVAGARPGWRAQLGPLPDRRGVHRPGRLHRCDEFAQHGPPVVPARHNSNGPASVGNVPEHPRRRDERLDDAAAAADFFAAGARRTPPRRPGSRVAPRRGRHPPHHLPRARGTLAADGQGRSPALGVKPGERVATLAWNGYRHMELYYAVSGSGAVLHTLNPRLHPDQVVYIADHAEDQVLFFDLTFLPLIEAVAGARQDDQALRRDDRPRAHAGDTKVANLLCYEDLLEPHDDRFDWPTFDENSASRRSATPRAPPATRRACCTATARRCCTPSRSRCPTR